MHNFTHWVAKTKCWQSVTSVDGFTGVCQKSNAEEQMLQLDLLSGRAGVHVVVA